MADRSGQGTLTEVLFAAIERRFGRRGPARLAGSTALGTMLLAAVEQQFPPARGILRDPLAESVLPLHMRAIARATRIGWVREWMLARLEREHPGAWAGLACRKRYIDDLLVAALAGEVGAVVSLGAGLDTRMFRISRPGVPVFEVDLAENIARKQAWIERQFPTPPPDLRLVSVDFDRDDLEAALVARGLPTNAPIFFVWEGVTQYLHEAGVRATFEFLRRAPAGSRLVFSHVLREFIDGSARHGLEAMHQRLVVQQGLWHFGLNADEVAPFVAAYGWRVVEQLGAPEFMARYVRPTGRALSVMAIERVVLAEKV